MSILENVLLALSSIKANKMRAFLTMLGIVIGIAAVISISAIANGGLKEIETSFEQLGTNRLVVYMNWNKRDEIKYRDFLTDEDYRMIQNMTDDIIAISPLHGGDWAMMLNGKKSAEIILYGVNQQAVQIDNIKMLSGRFITPDDMQRKRKVIVLSEKDARGLFGSVDVIGKTVVLSLWTGPSEFMIIGVSRVENSFMSQFVNGGRASAYVPITTLMKLYHEDRYYSFSIKVRDKEKIDQTGSKVIRLLERKHRNKDMYIYFNLQQMLDTVIKQMGMITTILALVAAIALLVGGIGIMNIMLVSITERTREIGIRKAVGAKRGVILNQFLIEAGIISLGGGIIGIALGMGIARLISLFMKLPPFISITDVLVAFVFSVLVGLVFGVYPASKASKLDPIQALRYE